MARPRTYAAPVAFRLPPPYQEKLESKAIRAGLPLAVYVRNVLMDVLDNGYKGPAKKPAARKTASTKASTANTKASKPTAKASKASTHRRTSRSTPA